MSGIEHELNPEELSRLPEDGGPTFNRLIFEKSPYLLQHARNPVDWYPWGVEAFERARLEDKPIFLSIGYATCHWCHVMAHESFEDEHVAGLLNEHFVPVKVDREERPDVDQLYMTVTQGLTGGGGWPMTVLLTPEARPFFAGTYFPRESRGGRAGMLELLSEMADAWRKEREKVDGSAEEITDWLIRATGGPESAALSADVLVRAYEQLAERFDAEHGGFGTRPKFPTPHNLVFLSRFWLRSGDAHALWMVETTLRNMREGGIWDHLGGGFHRYSTDPEWLVPHFEKMLYDQALIAGAYLEAFGVTGNRLYEATVREIFEYVLRELTHPEGGFYSAEDADSEGEEGKFYLWTTSGIRTVLREGADRFMQVYGISEDGNYLDEALGRRTGRNIPHLSGPLDEHAERMGVGVADLTREMEGARRRLMEVRSQRVRPLLDDKVLTDWNGLMIDVLARGGRLLGEPAYTAAAERAATFVWEHMRDDAGRLLKRWRSGTAGLPAHLDDYAFLADGLVALYEAGRRALWLERACSLVEQMIDLFWDEAGAGFFFTAEDSEPLLVRSKEIYDGALPSGNSAAALLLLRLGRITGRSEWEEKAVRLMESFGSQVARAPAAFTHLMCALDLSTATSREVVIAGAPQAADTRALLEIVDRRHDPHMVSVLRPEPDEEPDIVRLAPYSRDQRAIDGRAAAYVCRGYACRNPVTMPAELAHELENA